MFNMNHIVGGEEGQIGILDILTIFGLKTQLENIARDVEETEYIHKVIHAISDEITKLHEENDKILAELAEVKEMISKSGE